MRSTLFILLALYLSFTCAKSLKKSDAELQHSIMPDAGVGSGFTNFSMSADTIKNVNIIADATAQALVGCRNLQQGDTLQFTSLRWKKEKAPGKSIEYVINYVSKTRTVSVYAVWYVPQKAPPGLLYKFCNLDRE